MTFEEEFPSLQEYTCFTAVGSTALHREDVEKHCLDKRRVKEVINNAYMNSDNDARLDSTEVMKAILFKELGLED